MKKFFIVCLCLILLFSDVGFLKHMEIKAEVIEEYVENGIKYNIENGQATVIGLAQNMEEVEIPQKVKEADVTTIGESAFCNERTLKKITLPEGLVEIQHSAFADTGITNLHLPASCISFSINDRMLELQTITVDEKNPYYQSIDGVLLNKAEHETPVILLYPAAKRDEEYTVPEVVPFLYGSNFRQKKYLKKLNIRDLEIVSGIYQINCEIEISKDNSYYAKKDGILYNKELTEVLRIPTTKTGTIKLEKSVEIICDGAGCEGIFDNILIPEGVKRIETDAFRETKNLKKIVIPDNVKELEGNSTFRGCVKLEEVILPSNLTKIGSDTFTRCTSLKKITLPDQIKVIGAYSFSECNSLEKVTLPSELEEIDSGAFLECKNLRSITIPEKVNKIGEVAFVSCIAMREMYFEGEIPQIAEDAFRESNLTIYYAQDSNINAQDKLKNYSGKIQWYPYDVKTGVIHSGILGDLSWKEIKDGKLVIEGNGKMPNWKNSEELPWKICDEKIKKVILHSGVSNIGEKAFYHCDNIEEITIYNEKCNISDLSYLEGDITIHGYKYSTAEKCAKTYGYEFIEFARKSQKITASSHTKIYGSKAFSLGAKTSGNGKFSYSSSNKKAATVSSSGKVTIKGYGSTTITIRAASTGQYYSASKKITIKVVPKKGYLRSVTSPSKKKIKILWSKNSTVSGYQIYLSKKKDFSKDTKQNTYSMKKTSVIVDGWKSKTTYYVKIRSYKTVGKTKYYGAWSTIRSVKVK